MLMTIFDNTYVRIRIFFFIKARLRVPLFAQSIIFHLNYFQLNNGKFLIDIQGKKHRQAAVI